MSKDIAPKIFADNFSFNSRANYDLSYQYEFSRSQVKSVFNGIETVSYLGPRICYLLPLEMKQDSPWLLLKRLIRLGIREMLRIDCAKICCWCQTYLNYNFLDLLNVFFETRYIQGSSHMEVDSFVIQIDWWVSLGCGFFDGRCFPTDFNFF